MLWVGDVSNNCVDAVRVFLKYPEKSQRDVFCYQIGKYKCHPDLPHAEPPRAQEATCSEKQVSQNKNSRHQVETKWIKL